MPRGHTIAQRTFSTLGTAAALLLGTLLLTGCDVKTDVTFSPATNAQLQARVKMLETHLARQKARADRLQGALDRGGDTSVVRAGEEKFAFRINTPAAVVLVFTVLAAR